MVFLFPRWNSQFFGCAQWIFFLLSIFRSIFVVDFSYEKMNKRTKKRIQLERKICFLCRGKFDWTTLSIDLLCFDWLVVFRALDFPSISRNQMVVSVQNYISNTISYIREQISFDKHFAETFIFFMYMNAIFSNRCSQNVTYCTFTSILSIFYFVSFSFGLSILLRHLAAFEFQWKVLVKYCNRTKCLAALMLRCQRSTRNYSCDRF